MQRSHVYTLSQAGQHGHRRLRLDRAAGGERAIAREFTPYNEQQLAALSAKAEPVSKPGLFFRFYDHDAV